MIQLNNLKNTAYDRKKSKRVGRGPGSGLGKTCGRGEKGAGSRSGYTHRWGYEGGQFRTFMKMPIRGFSNARFAIRLDSINLDQIDRIYKDNEIVNTKTLAEKGFISGKSNGLKILGNGELNKKVTIEARRVSESAREKLQKHKIEIRVK